MQSDATSVEDYIDSLPDDRAEAISAVRQVILDNLPEGYVETMNWGMISYEIPLETYPDTYNKRPLMYAALASQKNHMAVYLTGVYSDDAKRQEFIDAYKATGKKLDMGKSCVRFKSVDQLPLELLGETIAATEVDDMIDLVEEAGSPRKAAHGEG